MSVYIPWWVDAQLSEPVTCRTFVGALRECIWAYAELREDARADALIVTDQGVPFEVGRSTRVLEAAEIKWLIDQLDNWVSRPKKLKGRWI